MKKDAAETTHEFDLQILGHDGMDVGFFELPMDVPKIFGRRGQVKIVATFDGEPYRGSLAPMTMPGISESRHVLILLKEIRRKIGKGVGDTVHVTIKEDTEPRIVEVPNDLAAQFLVNPTLEASFKKLSFTNQKEYARWITEAKRPETRDNRVAATIEKLTAGKRNPSEK